MYQKTFGISNRWVKLLAVGVILATGTAAAAQNKALIIGNGDYDEIACRQNLDLSGIENDVLQKNAALQNAGWMRVLSPNRRGAQMQADITANIPPAGKQYIVWFSGHGLANVGNPVGTDCDDLSPEELKTAIRGAEDRTLVILDSCYGQAFANSVNAKDDRIGFITAANKTQCSEGSGFGGAFTKCFVAGLSGAADGAGGGAVDGDITVAEAAAYAAANCAFDTQTPTWDGDHAAWVIGRAASKCTTKCKDTTVNVSVQAGGPACNNHCNSFCASHDGIFSCSFEGENLKGNCDVLCEDGRFGHVTLVNPTDADCHAACDDFCVGNENVLQCALKGQPIKQRVPAVSTGGMAAIILMLLTGISFKFGRSRLVKT